MGWLLSGPVNFHAGEDDLLCELGRQIPEKVHRNCHPSIPLSCTNRLLERAEDICSFTWAFADHFLAVFGESRFIEVQGIHEIHVKLQMTAHTMCPSTYVIYINRYEIQKVIRPAMLRCNQDVCVGDPGLM